MNKKYSADFYDKMNNSGMKRLNHHVQISSLTKKVSNGCYMIQMDSQFKKDLTEVKFS